MEETVPFVSKTELRRMGNVEPSDVEEGPDEGILDEWTSFSSETPHRVHRHSSIQLMSEN